MINNLLQVYKSVIFLSAEVFRVCRLWCMSIVVTHPVVSAVSN